MQSINEFFRSKSFKVIGLFLLGVLFLSRDPWVQKQDLFMPFTEILSRMPVLPALPGVDSGRSEIKEPGRTEKNGAGNTEAAAYLLNPALSAQETGKVDREADNSESRALDSFCRKLLVAQSAKSNTETALLRVLHYGDSILWGDNITARLRAHFTNSFGNGGRGLLPLAYQSTDYKLSRVEQQFSGNWNIRNLMTTQNYTSRLGLSLRRYTAGYPQSRSRYRLPPGEGGARLRIFGDGSLDGIRVRFQTAESGGSGQPETRGEAELRVLSNVRDSVLLQSDFRDVRLEVPRGRTLTGVSVEKERGVLFSPVIRKGIFAQDFRQLDRNFFVKQLKEFKPDLVLFQFGKNESGWDRFSIESHQAGVEAFINMVRAADKDCAVLLVGPAGRLNKHGGPLRLFPTIPKIIAAQKALARKHHCAFFDSFQALGGTNAMKAMVANGEAMSDYVHLTLKGGDRLADLLFADFEKVYRDYLKRQDARDAAGGGMLRYFSRTANPDQGEIQKAVSSINFDTVAFVYFFLLVFFAYWLLYRHGMLRIAVLLIASYFFYMSWNPVFIILIVISTLVDYSAGFLIDKARRRDKMWQARIYLIISLASNLGLLFFFKYFNLFADFINQTGLASGRIEFISLILPVGISFYTFQTMSYTLDIYGGRLHPIHSLPKFALFVSFFPQLVAGPIVRARDFLPQLYRRPALDDNKMLAGLFLILVGLFKKVILSDFIAVNFVDRVFAGPEMYSSLENLLAVYGYGLQIYCDFSGYSDIAIGAAAMLGFTLPLNFNSPYKAHNLQDFWHRWHISLSTWLRDYLYVPLGGNRKGKVRTYINLIITMLLGGLWHGAAYRFILWGAIHGTGLAAVRWLQRWRKRRGKEKPLGPWQRFRGWLITFHFVSFAWIFFRAQNMETAGKIIEKIGSLPELLPEFGAFLNSRVLDFPAKLAETLAPYIPNVTGGVALILFGGYLLHMVPNRIFNRTKEAFVRLPVFWESLVMLLFAALLYKTATAEVVPFIYFQF